MTIVQLIVVMYNNFPKNMMLDIIYLYNQKIT